LLQREGKHKEAAEHFQVAVQLAPNSGIWLMGYGISLQALERNDDAKKSFQQALDTNTLSPELTAFVQQKIKNF
jgi:MSHA biogenesis protein MshN